MNRKLVTIVSSVVVGGLLLTGGVIAIAGSSADTNTSATQKAYGKMFDKGGPRGGHMDEQRGGPGGQLGQQGRDNRQEMVANLTANLVKEGIITQETADKMASYNETKNTERAAEMEKIKAMTEDERKAYFESKKDTKPQERKEPMSELVEAGILTQAQADSIKTYAETQAKTQRQAAVKKQLDTLVSNSTITADQENKIIAYLQTLDENRKAEMDKMKAMTEEERKAAFESRKDNKSESIKASPMAQLVTDGTLTQAQADAAAKVLFSQGPDSGHQKGPGMHKGK